MHLVTVHLIRTLVSRAPPYSAPEDRVHLIGFDVHDPKECAQLMSAIAGPDFVYVATRAVDLVDGLDSAVQGLWSGNPAPCLANKEKIEALAASVAAREQQTPRALPLGHFGRLADGTKRLTSA